MATNSKPAKQYDSTPATPTHRGFLRPTTTPTPDEIFDVWLAQLLPAELKVLLYIVRRTFGFKKDRDTISLKQICEGIKTRDGRILDRGTGLSRKAASFAVQSLEKKGLIRVDREVAEDGVNQVNLYSLVFVAEENPEPSRQLPEESERGVVAKSNYGRYQKLPGVGTKYYPQQTVLQETDKQQRGPNNNNNTDPTAKAGATDVVVALLVQKGMTKTVAKKLAAQYPEEYIRLKVEALEYLQDTSPDQVKEPAAWLRRSIEQDWKPPTKFKTKAERDAEAQAKAEAEVEKQRQQEEERRRRQEEREARKQQVRQLLSEQYGVTPETFALWDKIQEELKEKLLLGEYLTWVAPAALLTVADHQVTIAVPYEFTRDQIQDRLHEHITEVVTAILDRPVEVEYQVIPELHRIHFHTSE